MQAMESFARNSTVGLRTDSGIVGGYGNTRNLKKLPSSRHSNRIWLRVARSEAPTEVEKSGYKIDGPSSKSNILRSLEKAVVNGTAVDHKSVNEGLKSGSHFDDHPLKENGGRQNISDFLYGKVLLVTGATGFLAKVLVEKILREQPGVGHIYLIIQPRADMDPSQRLEKQVFNSKVFDRLKDIYSDGYGKFMRSKVSAISGNVSEDGLGIDLEASGMLKSTVDVIINSAATTTFDERFDQALSINTLGAKRLVDFAVSCKKLQLFLHVSTAFTNGMREGPTPEKPFVMGDSIRKELTGHTWLPGVSVKEELEVMSKTLIAAQQEARNLHGEKADALIQKRMVDLGMKRAQIHGWQDTYVFTKAMGEMLIWEHRAKLPVAIVRPSIVESSLSEPLLGWMEGIRMADPILIAYGKGQMGGFLADKNGWLDVVPVDFVINTILAILPKHANQSDLTVYHVATSVCNPLSHVEVTLAATEHFNKFPMLGRDMQPIRNAPMQVFPSALMFQIHMLLKYQLPLQTEKMLLTLSEMVGNSSKSTTKKRNSLVLKTFEQLTYLAKLYRPYTFYKCKFDASNTLQLFAELSDDEKGRFNFDLTRINWREYLVEVHLPGLRKYVLKGRGGAIN